MVNADTADRADRAMTTRTSRSGTLLRIGCLAALLASCGRAAASTAAAPTQADAEAALRKNTQSLLNAIAPGDTATWNRLIDSTAIFVDENDKVYDKPQMLAQLKPLGPGLVGNLAIDDFVVKLHGTTAVVAHEDNEYLNYHGQIIRSRFRNTDVWEKQGDEWREISSMVLAVLKDPPAITLDHASLCAYNGRYAMTDSIVATMQCSGDSLVVKRDAHPDRVFLPETRDVFFEPGAPRTRRIMQRDASGRVIGFVDRREARDIVWKRTGGGAS
jgi:hypothetical protein